MTKLITLSEAVSRYVADGDVVYAAGFTHLIPFAAGHEIIRQGSRNLTLARATPDLIYDQMVAAGCARKVIFSYMGNPGSARCASSAPSSKLGRLEWEEYSHFGMISRLQAGATGLPFMPMNPTAAARPGKRQPEVPHGHRPLFRQTRWWSSRHSIRMSPSCTSSARDADGNAHIWGIIGEQKEAAFAAKRVILTAEEIVDEAVIRSDPNRTLIPGFIVDAVCHVPYCAPPILYPGLL